MSKIIKAGSPPIRMPRYLVYGRNKQGKTFFASTAPHVLLLDPEGGAREQPHNVDVWPITGWKDLEEVFQFLKGKHEYQWVAIDGLTRLNNMALRHTMKLAEERDLDRIPGMVDRRDYNKSGELMKGFLFNFHNLTNLGLVYTAQDRMEAGDKLDFDLEDEAGENVDARFVPDLPKGVRSTVNALVDCIGRIYSVNVTGTHPKTKEEVTARSRRLHIAPSEIYDTGYRSPHKGIPPYLKKPTVERLQTLLEEGTI